MRTPGLLARILLLGTTMFCAHLAAPLALAADQASKAPDFQWLKFPDETKIQVLGLHWFPTNSPRLWRLPASGLDALPRGVQERSKCPSGARLLLDCNSTRVAVKLARGGAGGFSALVNGKILAAEKVPGQENTIAFSHLDNRHQEILIYLPQSHEVEIEAIGVDPGAKLNPPHHEFSNPLPFVFYGSSVCQGSGAAKAAMTYEAIACRELNADFINLGFGGAGKAEPPVVSLVNSIPAGCYIFDLGKSYGAQDGSAFEAMLRSVRQSHPRTPILCLTPITSAREVNDPAYSERSLHTRQVMRAAARNLIKSGDTNLFILEGEDLLGFKEHATLSKDGVHPSDEGYGLIARKLLPALRSAATQPASH